MKVSIIIATYNAGKTLKRALDSVINQTFQDWECIIVDGASKDGTISIVEKYAQQDPRFHYISEPDKGIYDAFNKGWKMANGEWIHYLGSDDWLTTTSFVDLLKVDAKDAAVLSGNIYTIKPDGTRGIVRSVGFRGGHQGKLTKRTIIQQLGGYDEQFRIVADADMYYKMEYLGMKAINVDTYVACFSLDGISQRISTLLLRTKELYKIYKKYQKHPHSRICSFFIRSIISMMLRKIKNLINHKN